MDRQPPTPHTAADRYATWVVRLRWVIVVGWMAAAAAAVTWLPTISEAGSGAVGTLVPRDARALVAEQRAARDFEIPLLSRNIAVVREEGGLSEPTLRRLGGAVTASAQRAGQALPFAVVREAPPIDLPPRVAVVAPIVGFHEGPAGVTPEPEPGEAGDTAVAFLGFGEDVSEARGARLTEETGRAIVAGTDATFVGATGAVPARIAGQQAILDTIGRVEMATIALVVVLVALHFRALVAPLVNLLSVGVAYLVADRGLGWLGTTVGVDVPREVEPVIVVLLFGVVTDYFVFFTSRFGACLGDSRSAVAASRRAAADVAGAVAVAGLTVAAATSALLVADLEFFRVFGPGLALCILVGVAVAVTFIPALLAVTGRAVFWPMPGAADRAARRAERAAEIAGRARGWWRHPRALLVNLATRLHVLVVLAVGALLVLGGLGLQHLRLDNPLIRELPDDSDPAVAYRVAAAGFGTGGVVAPAQVVVRAPGVAESVARLRAVEERVEALDGVAVAVGAGRAPAEALGAMRTETGDAVRMLVVFDGDPYGAAAIETVRRMESRLPGLLADAGIEGARVEVSGDTALSAQIVARTRADLLRVAPVAILAITIVLALYLRAGVVAGLLVAASVLSVPAALGVVGWFLADVLGAGSIAYFVPFATAILLLALGCDYNVFLLGRIRREARDRPLREAVGVAGTRASRPITAAGVILAASFALLALVPLESFRMIAAIMAVGLLIDTLLVRTLLMPALVSMLGRRAGWG